MIKNVISVIDGVAGSSGKGKVIGEIVTDNNIKINAAITNCYPNAGHTVIHDKKRIFKNIPVSIINPNPDLFIGPGSIINLNDFVKEYEDNKDLLCGRKIYVHEMVPVILDEHIKIEKELIKSGSTFKGCGAAACDKTMRKSTFFKGYKNAIVVSNEEWLGRLHEILEEEVGYVLMEGAQGCDLSINHSGNYPYTTSRNVSTTQMLADCGIPAERLLETIMVIRPFPIRISNITDIGYINSGECGSGEELTWSHINYASIIGTYPTVDIFNHLEIVMDAEYIRLIKSKLTDINLLQIFKNKPISLDKVSVLEMERMYFKNLGRKNYYSEFLSMEMHDLSENTTVTMKERRIFDLDIEKLELNCRLNAPYGLYLNFFQQLNYIYNQVSDNGKTVYFDRYIREYMTWLEESTDTNILALGTGAKNNERILMKNLIKQ
ncbi:MAG: adenylosuccinate synthetase [bacterium]